MEKPERNGMPLSVLLGMDNAIEHVSANVCITTDMHAPESRIDTIRRDVAIAQYGALIVSAVVPKPITGNEYVLVYVCPDYKPFTGNGLLPSHNQKLAFAPAWRTGDTAYIVDADMMTHQCRIVNLSDINGNQTATIELHDRSQQVVPVPCLFETSVDTTDAIQHKNDCDKHPEKLHVYNIRAVRYFTAAVKAHNLKEALSMDPGERPPKAGSNVMQEFLPASGFKILRADLDTDYFQESE